MITLPLKVASCTVNFPGQSQQVVGHAPVQRDNVGVDPRCVTKYSSGRSGLRMTKAWLIGPKFCLSLPIFS